MITDTAWQQMVERLAEHDRQPAKRSSWRDFTPPNGDPEYTRQVHRIRVRGERYTDADTGERKTGWRVDGIAVDGGRLLITELEWWGWTFEEALAQEVPRAAYVFSRLLDFTPRPLPAPPQ